LKKLVIILLIFIFLFDCIGINIVLISLYSSSKTISLKINKDEIKEYYVETLIISSEDFNNKSKFNKINDKEFWYNNSLYDIISVDSDYQKVVIKCICDIKEQKYAKDLANVVDKDNQQKKQSDKIPDFVKKIVKNYYNNFLIYSFINKSEDITYIETTDFYKSINKTIYSPPPKLFFS
jgi:hypothetical protein